MISFTTPDELWEWISSDQGDSAFHVVETDQLAPLCNSLCESGMMSKSRSHFDFDYKGSPSYFYELTDAGSLARNSKGEPYVD